MINTDPAKTHTVEDFIDMKSNDDYTYAIMALYMQSIVDKTVIYSSDNVLYTYLKELKSYSIKYTFTEDEYYKYRFRPKLLAYDIYGSTELYFIILALNDMCNIKDFNKRTLNLLYKSDLSDLLSQIMETETNRLSLNRKAIELGKEESDV